MENFSKTVTYVCCYVLKLRDRSDDREVAREIYSRVRQGSKPQKGVLLNLEMFFFYQKVELPFLQLCDVEETKISALYNIMMLGNVGSQHRDVSNSVFELLSGTSRRWILMSRR